MGRREEETQDVKLPAEVADALDDLLLAFDECKFPNRAMVVLADLALTEYRLATRSIDRKHWHGQLVAVAKVCQEYGQGSDDDSAGRGDELEVVTHEGGNERDAERGSGQAGD